MRIGLVVWNLCLTRGGLERVGAELADAMHARGHDVTLFYVAHHRMATKPLTRINPAVRSLPLVFQDYKWRRNMDFQLQLARDTIAACSLDVLAMLISSDGLLLFPSILRGLGVPFLVSEHNDPRIINTERWNGYERHACLYAADRIHCLSDHFVQFYPSFLWERISVIPNAVPQAVCQPSRIEKKEKVLLAAGRFVDKHKQFSLLLEAFALLTGRFPEWRLILCGDGRDKWLYRRLIRRFSLSACVDLPGMTDDMPSFYAKSDLFCIPSRYEGFGLVTVEAATHGLPAVGFAGCPGVNEVIVHEESGLLAPAMNAESLAEQLAALMADSAQRESMGRRALELSTRFEPESVYDRWEDLLQRTTACKGNTRLQQARLPENEEDRCEFAFSEILMRPSPFVRHDWSSTDKREKQRWRFPNMLKKIFK